MSTSLTPPHVPLLPGMGEEGRGERAVLKKDVAMSLRGHSGVIGR